MDTTCNGLVVFALHKTVVLVVALVERPVVAGDLAVISKIIC